MIVRRKIISWKLPYVYINNHLATFQISSLTKKSPSLKFPERVLSLKKVQFIFTFTNNFQIDKSKKISYTFYVLINGILIVLYNNCIVLK